MWITRSERLRDLPDLLHAERVDLWVPARKTELLDRGAGEVALRPLGQHGDLRDDVGAGLEVAELLALAPATPVAGADAADGAVVDEQLRSGGLGQDRRADLLGLVTEPAAELGERHDHVAVVAHRRRRRNAEGVRARKDVDRLAVNLAEARELVGLRASAEEATEPARVDDRAGQEVGSRLLSLLQHGERHLAEPLGHLRRLLEQLPEADRAREPGGAGAHDRNAYLDPLVGRIGRRPDRLGRGGRRVVGRAHRHPALRVFTSSVSFGTTECRSPTTPRSQNSKIGAFGSLLIAMITPDPCIPTLCWIAPEMPQAT